MKLRVAVISVAVVLTAVGCSLRTQSGTERNVFAVASGFSQGGPGIPSEILDIGLPALSNISHDRVRLTGISLAGTSKGVQLHSVTAFLYGDDGGLGLSTGNVTRCKGARPLNVVVTPPGQRSAWYVVIAVTFSRPGHYYIGKARIDYIANGVRGWQYQNLFTRMVIKKLPPGVKPKYSNPCP
jgi:hypothetical protein